MFLFFLKKKLDPQTTGCLDPAPAKSAGAARVGNS